MCLTKNCPPGRPCFQFFILPHFQIVKFLLLFRRGLQTHALQPCHGPTMFSKVQTSKSLQTSTSSLATASVPFRWSNSKRKSTISRFCGKPLLLGLLYMCDSFGQELNMINFNIVKEKLMRPDEEKSRYLILVQYHLHS